MVRILTTRGCTEKNRNRHGELLKGTSVLLRWRISQKASLDCYAIIETRHICIKGGNIPPPLSVIARATKLRRVGETKAHSATREKMRYLTLGSVSCHPQCRT